MVVVRYSAEALSAYQHVITQTFDSKEEIVDFYNNYARGKGFSTRKCYLERIKGTKQVCLRKLVCSRQGFREGKHMKRTGRKGRARNLTCLWV
jgi:zinc finger SWIM domain-containing protein 3